MADEKIISSLTSLNKNVEGIHGQIKKFGPKLPSGNSSEEDEIKEANLNTFTAIAGLLGVLFGKKVTKLGDVTQIINKSASKDNLFFALKGFIDKQIDPQNLYRKDSVLEKFIKQNIGEWSKEFAKSYEPTLKKIYGENFDAITNLHPIDTEDLMTFKGNIFEWFSDDFISALQEILPTQKHEELKLDNTTVIESYISEINGSINNLIKNLQAVITKSQQDLLNEAPLKGKIDIELITNSKDISELLDKLSSLNNKEIEDSVSTLFSNLSSFIKLIEKLESETKSIDTEKIKTNIEDLSKIIVGNESFEKLINNLYNILPPEDKSKKKATDLTGVLGLLEQLNEIAKLEGKPSNINIILNEYIGITKKGGNLEKIIKNLSELGQIAVDKQIITSVNAIGALFNLVNKSIYISPFKALKIKFGLMNFRLILSKEFIKFVDEIKDMGSMSKEQVTTISAINSLMEAVTKIGDVGIITQIKALINLTFFRNFIKNDLKKTLEEIGGSLSKPGAEKIEATLKGIKEIFDTVINLGKKNDKEEFDFDEAEERAETLLSILEDDIVKIINVITNYSDLKEDNIVKVSNYLENVKKMVKTLPGIMTLLSSTIKVGLLNETLTGLTETIKTIDSLSIRNRQQATSFWNNIEFEILSLGKLNKFIIENSIDTKKAKGVIDKDILKEIASIKELTDGLNDLNKLAVKLSIIGKTSVAINKGVEAIILMISLINDKLTPVINKISIDEKKIKELTTGINELIKVVVTCAGLLLFAGLAMMIIPVTNVILFTLTLTIFVGTVLGVFGYVNKHIKEVSGAIKDFTLLVIASSAILLLAGLIFNSGMIASALAFTVCLAGFIWAMVKIYVKASEDMKTAIGGLEDFALLIAISGLVLIYGSVIYHFIDWGDLFGFTVALAIFMFSISWSYILLTKFANKSFEGIRDLTILVTASTLVLIIGAVANKHIQWKDVFGFTFKLATFMGILVALFALPKMIGNLLGGIGDGSKFKWLKKLNVNPFQEAMVGLRDFSILVIASGLVMVLGASMHKYIDYGALAGFAFTLGFFIVGVMSPFIFAKNSGQMKIAKNSAKEFGLILLFSAGILILGGLLFTLYPQIISGVALFAIVLGGFVWGVCKAFNRFNSKKMWPRVIGFLLITVVTGALLLYAGKLMADNPDMWWAVPLFAVTLFGYIMGMKVALNALSKIQGNLIKSVIALGLMTGITYLAAMTLNLAFEMGAKYSWAAMGKGILALIAGLVLIGLAYWGLGYATFFDAGIGLGLATLSLTAISGLTFLTANALMYVTKHNKDISVAEIDKFKEAIKKFGELGRELINQFGSVEMMFVLPLVSSSASSLSITLSMIARSVKDYASLVVPEYEGTKIVSYRKLEKTDFTEAANNVAEIIKTLGSAVIKAYNENEEIFDTNLFGTSKFAKVTKSLNTLAPLISNIAESVKDYATLRVPIYKGTKVIGYRSLGEQDFTDAADNINSILTTLGKPIEEIANGPNFELYNSTSGFFGIGGTKSKFAKVIEGNIQLAKLISRIGNAVAGMSNLNVATEWYTSGENIGKPKKYERLDVTHFENASKNIKEILTSLAKPIEEIANTPKQFELYNSVSGTFGIGGEKSKFVKVIEGNIQLAKLVSRIGTAVANMSNLNVATEWYTSGEHIGKPKKYRQLNVGDFFLAGINTYLILTALAEPIKKIAGGKDFDLYNSVSGTFGIGGEKSKFVKVIEGNIKLAEMVSKIGTAIKTFAALNMPVEFDKNGKPTKYVKMTPTDIKTAGEKIGEVITTIGQGIVKAIGDHPELFGQNGLDAIFNKKSVDELPVMVAAKAISTIGTPIVQIAGVLKSYSGSQFFDPSDKEHKTPLTLSQEQINKAKKNIGTIISSLGSTMWYELTQSDHKEIYNKQQDITTAQGVMNLIIKIIKDVIGNFNSIFKQLSQEITIGSNKTTVLDAFTNIVDSKTNRTLIQDKIITIIDVIGSLGEEISKNNFGNISDKEQQYQNVISIINSIITNSSSIAKLLASINEETFIKKLAHIVTGFNVIVSSLSSISNAKSNVSDGSLFGTIKSSIMGDGTITDDINLYCDSIQRIIELSKDALEVKNVGFNYLSNGIDRINTSISNIQDQEAFEQHQKVMDKYINTINKIDIMKANKLFNIVNAMNVLASRMGNLDNLTAAISDGLTIVLDKLVRELTTAKETINKAEKIQKNRHELMKKQVAEIKTIMNQKLTIEIMKVEDNEPLSDPTSGVPSPTTNSGSSTTSQTGGGNTSSNGSSTTNNPSNVDSNGGPTNRTKSKPDITNANGKRSQSNGTGLTINQIAALLDQKFNKIPNSFRMNPDTHIITPMG